MTHPTVAVLSNLVLAIPLLSVCLVSGRLLIGNVARLRQRAPLVLLCSVVVATWLVVVTEVLARGGPLWTWAGGRTMLGSLPVDVWLGWTLAWGALPALLGGRWWAWLAGFAWVDLVTMPALEPLLTLGPHWWVGEIVLLLAVAAPTLLLREATENRRWLWFRVGTQGLTFTTLVVGGVGTLALHSGGQRWSDLVDHSLGVRTVLLVSAVVIAVPTLAAVAELARVGQGTPYPWDPPDRLVSTGPYAYLANPMQFGLVAALLWMAAAAGSWRLAAAAGVAAAFSVALALPHEERALAQRWPLHPVWRAQMKAWWPRWRPVVLEPATLWVSDTCTLCRATGDTLLMLHPIGLTQRPAEQAGVRLTRMRWAGPAGHDRGVAALARALEHGNLASAWCGWLLRLPLAGLVFQAIADASGFGPRAIPPAPLAPGSGDIPWDPTDQPSRGAR